MNAARTKRLYEIAHQVRLAILKQDWPLVEVELEAFKQVDKRPNPDSPFLQAHRVFSAMVLLRRDRNLESFSQLDWDRHDYPGYQLERAFAWLMNGKNEEAAQCLESTPKAARSGLWYARLGIAKLGVGDFESGFEACERARQLLPDSADILCNRAAAMVRLHRLEEALSDYDQVLVQEPEHPVAQNARRAILHELGRGEAAIVELQDNLAKHPDSVQARLALFNCFARLGQEDEALNLLKEVLQPLEELAGKGAELKAVSDSGVTPSENDIKARETFAQQLAYRWALQSYFEDRNNWRSVVALLNQIRRMHGDPVPVGVMMPWIIAVTEMGQGERALRELDELCSKAQANPEDESLAGFDLVAQTSVRANVFFKLNREAEALALIEALPQEHIDDPRLQQLRAQLLRTLGHVDESADVLESLTKHNPNAFIQLAQTRKIADSPRAKQVLTRIADHPMHHVGVRESASFALAEVFESEKDYPRAMHYLKLANDLAKVSIGYEPESFEKEVDKMIEVWTPEFFANRPRLSGSDILPVFVVGMPRSGTTLTESILGSHPEIFAAGELSYLPEITRRMHIAFKPEDTDKLPPRYPYFCRSLRPGQWQACATRYVNRISEHSTTHRWIVDKLPHNFTHVGFIHTLFPQGKIIHIRRDPRDVAVSNYQQNFGAKFGGLGYAFDLQHIARQLNDYHRLMAHWRELGVPMLEFFYEDLVANQVEVSAQLLNFVGAEWDDSVLDFNQLERAVRTASVTQVRQPMYQTSAQKWRKYEKWLGPLLDNLKPEVTAPWD